MYQTTEYQPDNVLTDNRKHLPCYFLTFDDLYLFIHTCVCAQDNLKWTQSLKAFTKYIYFAKKQELFSNRLFFSKQTLNLIQR